MSLIHSGKLADLQRSAHDSARRAVALTGSHGPLVFPAAAEDPLNRIWLYLTRYAPVLAAAVVLGGMLGWFYALRVVPQYRATATIEVQDLNENFLNLKEVTSPAQQPLASNDLQTQLRILQSSTLISRVLARVGAPAELPANAVPDARVEAAARNLRVRETRQSRIVDLVYEGPDPAYAAAFVNQLGRQYIDQSVESRLEISRSTSAWLGDQLEELRRKLLASERELQNYAQRSGLLVTSVAERPDEEKLRQVQANLSDAQKNRMIRQARWEMAIAAPLESLEPPVGSPMREHQTRIAELRRQRADLLAMYTPEFAGVKRLEAQIADLELTLRGEKAVVLQTIGNDHADAVRREALLQASYEAQVRMVEGKSGKAIQYGVLKNEVDSNRQLYNTMLHKAAEAKVAAAMRASNARFVDRATPPRLPFKPSRALSVLAGASVGLLGGLLLVTVKERAAAPRTGGVPLATLLRVPELATVPAYATPPPEVYRSLMTSILFSPPAGGAPPRVIAATSATKGEGKSEIIIQLAATLSRAKRRVLLIDASRDGGLLARLGEVRNQNLGELTKLPGEDSELLPYHFHPTGMDGVDLAVIGTSETTAMDLMFTEGLDRLLDGVRQNYDVVLIDTPALRDTADARVFGRMADGVVLVVDSGLSTPQEAADAITRLQADQSVVLGIVVNRV